MMHNHFIVGLLLVAMNCTSLFATTSDSLRTTSPVGGDSDSIVKLGEVVVSTQNKKRLQLKPIPAIELDASYLHRHLSYSWVNTLANLPGVRAMNIGGGFGKPMIRGLSFNRVAYVEGDLKQEGQQWGEDHGLEVDAFENCPVTVIKGPRSLLYGSDALGGVVVSSLPTFPLKTGFYGEFSALSSTINGSFGGSILANYSTPNYHLRLRYSEQHYGDLRVNTDSITYLTVKIPIYNRRMKNTAGINRALKASFSTKIGAYNGFFQVSDLYEKEGFFPGAHGIPNLSRLQNDGKRYDIDLPFSKVNHFKLYARNSYLFSDSWAATLSLAYQQNRRSEWSLFHTHYTSQKAPERDPNKELALNLHATTVRGEVTCYSIKQMKITAVSDFAYKWQDVGGYGFLIPAYRQHNGGIGVLAEYNASPDIKWEGGIRYDHGGINATESIDKYLESYLKENGFSPEIISENRVRSKGIARSFGSFSGSIGGAYKIGEYHHLKFDLGMGFRFPGINELASNGVHHGSFRHERGDISLSPERAIQLSTSYSLLLPKIEFSIQGFYHYFFNYIYATPTGKWSVLPHSGQLYEFRQNKALLFGGEAEIKWHWTEAIRYENAIDYVYTYNVDLDSPLPFSPPLRMRQTICYKDKHTELALSHQLIGPALRIVPGEEKTPGAQLVDAYASYELPLQGVSILLSLSVNNILNKRYYDHLSFYRKIGLPEAGRNCNITMKVTF